MNMRDSEVVCGLLAKAGYKITDNSAKADVIIFNTCSVRQHAEDKVWSEAGRFKKGKIIGVIGCMAQNYGQGIFERSPNVSFVVGRLTLKKFRVFSPGLAKTKIFLKERYLKQKVKFGLRKFIIPVFTKTKITPS